jgi:hypothetical protein
MRAGTGIRWALDQLPAGGVESNILLVQTFIGSEAGGMKLSPNESKHCRETADPATQNDRRWRHAMQGMGDLRTGQDEPPLQAVQVLSR